MDQPNQDNLITEYRPDEISVYLVQESELIMVAKGADSLPQQLAIASLGASLGALPGAITAIQQLQNYTKRPDLTTVVHRPVSHL